MEFFVDIEPGPEDFDLEDLFEHDTSVEEVPDCASIIDSDSESDTGNHDLLVDLNTLAGEDKSIANKITVMN